MTSDDRMTWALIGEVLNVLERHGYHHHDDRHTAHAVGAIADLASIYDGTRDVSYGYCAPPERYAGPAPSGPEEDDAVILTDAEASTVAAALDIAADFTRDRAGTCAECADRTCPACQSRLSDAQTYHQMAAQMRQAAEASRTASPYLPELGDPPEPSRQPLYAADKEAGQ